MSLCGKEVMSSIFHMLVEHPMKMSSRCSWSSGNRFGRGQGK